MSRRSPEAATQLRKNLIARNKLNFTTIDLTDATFNLDSPRLYDIRVGRSIKSLDQGKRKISAFSFREL